jgi:four helix bundle protein
MRFAVRALALIDRLPKSIAGRTVGGQLARAATSVAANYRAALRGKSRADFINKITIVLEEADESEFWLTLIPEAALLDDPEVQSLRAEANELTRSFSATRTTARTPKS